MELTLGQVDGFRADGYVVIDRLIDDDAVTALRAAYDEVVSSDADGDRHLGGLTRQVAMPATYHPVFADNPARTAAAAVARQLLDSEVFPAFEQLLFKPPGHPHETPWHQDMSYAAKPLMPAGVNIPLDTTIQFWIALDDADVENGCMHFIPGQQTKPLLEHRVASGDPESESRLLALVDPAEQLDLSSTVACPLRAGGSTVHSFGTPHQTPPNRSADRPRRAYIMTFIATGPLLA